MYTSLARRTFRKVAAGGALAAALALPLVVATPAQAATSSGCTVTPLKPTFAGFNSSGVKLVRFRVRVTCVGDRTVSIQQQRYEEDTAPNPDDFMGTVRFTRTFDDTKTITVSSRRALPDTEAGNEEIYQRVRFRVTSNGVTSPWTTWQRTSALSILN